MDVAVLKLPRPSIAKIAHFLCSQDLPTRITHGKIQDELRHFCLSCRDCYLACRTYTCKACGRVRAPELRKCVCGLVCEAPYIRSMRARLLKSPELDILPKLKVQLSKLDIVIERRRIEWETGAA